jgi:hypothetical protein
LLNVGHSLLLSISYFQSRDSVITPTVPPHYLDCQVTTPLRGQHHVQHLLVKPAEGGGYRVTSYWVFIQWDAEGDRKYMRTLGSYVDICGKVEGQWRVTEKISAPWNSASAAMIGHLP